MCQTKFIFTKTSSILDIFINSILHLFRMDIHVTKLKVFFPLVFQIIFNHANIYVHANSLRQFAMDMMS
jgi:hypothetical protein